MTYPSRPSSDIIPTRIDIARRKDQVSSSHRITHFYFTMTRTEIVEKLTLQFPELQMKDVDMSVRTILDGISSVLSDGGRAEIRGFGSFALNYKPPRKGRNPKTGATVMVSAKYVPHFKAGLELRERVDYK